LRTTTEALLAHIESLGYATSVHLINGVTEMHAVLKSDPDQQHIARMIDGNGEVEQYHCACLLAHMVGIELEDG